MMCDCYCGHDDDHNEDYIFDDDDDDDECGAKKFAVLSRHVSSIRCTGDDDDDV